MQQHHLASLLVFLSMAVALSPQYVMGNRGGFVPVLSEPLPNANAIFSAEIIRDTDGGAYAVMVTITNLSATNDLRFRVMDQPDKVFLVGATSGRGELGKPWRTWMPEELHAVEFNVPKNTGKRWFIRLESRLIPPTEWPDPTKVVLSVGFPTDFRMVDPTTEVASPWAATTAALLFQNVTLTHKALAGDAAEKYKKSLSSAPTTNAVSGHPPATNR